MNNNKGLLKTREKSNREMRKMFPKDGDDIGIIDGEHVSTEKKYTKRSKLSHNK